MGRTFTEISIFFKVISEQKQKFCHGHKKDYHNTPKKSIVVIKRHVSKNNITLPASNLSGP